jgi:predicted dehydrogenase
MGSSSSSGGTVRIAVIGAGGICNAVHLPSLCQMPDVEVVAICDLVEERAVATAAKWQIPKSYTLIREMFKAESLDAVFCLVEPGSLFHVTMLALEHGYPVFSEKPPCITSTQAEALARRSDQIGKPVMIGFNRRFIPVVREAKKQLLQINSPTQVEGCFYKYGSGDCFDLGGINAFTSDTIHALDLMRFLSGGNRARKAALLSYARECVMENQWNGIFEFDNGVAGIINGNYMAGGRIHKFQLHAPAVSASINLGFGPAAAEATILNHTGGISYSLAAAGAVNEEIKHLDGKELAGSEDFHRYYGYYFEDRHFIDCLKSGQTPETCIQDAKESLHLAEQLLAAKI